MGLVEFFVTVLCRLVTIKPERKAFMNNLDSLVSDKYPNPVSADTNLASMSTERLVIPVLEADIDISLLAQRIYKLAVSMRSDVLLIGISPDYLEEASIRRQLVTLAAAIQDRSFSLETMVLGGVSWMKKMEAILRPGDMIVIQAKEEISTESRSLSQELTSRFQAPVYILSGLNSPRYKHSGYLSQLILWLGAIAIMAGFFWIQVKIDQLPTDWAHTTLLLVSVIIEFGLLLLWNSLFS
jgi:hypothetical protein